jgi:hypothetical protein
MAALPGTYPASGAIPWSPAISAEMTYYVHDMSHPDVWPIRGQDRHYVVTAPDGKKMFYVTRRGDLSSDSTIYTVHVVDIASAQKGVLTSRNLALTGATCAADFSTTSSALPAIREIRWDENSEAILAIRQLSDETAEIERIDAYSCRHEPATTPDFNIAGYESKRGTFFFTTRAAHDDAIDSYPMFLLPRSPDGLVDLWTGQTDVLKSSCSGCATKIQGPGFGQLWLNQSGERAVSLRFLRGDARGSKFVLLQAAGPESPVNLAFAGPATVHAPTAAQNANVSLAEPQAHWIDENTALLVNAEDLERARLPAIISVDVRDRSKCELTPMVRTDKANRTWSVGSVQVDAQNSTLIISWQSSGSPSQSERYRRAGGCWIHDGPAPKARQRRPRIEGARSEPVIKLIQSVDRPLEIRLMDGPKSIRLNNADPVLNDVVIAGGTNVHWNDRKGRRQVSTLYLPAGARPSHGFPMVVQSMDNQPDVYLPDGYPTGSYATQSLVAAGIAVLNVDSNRESARAGLRTASADQVANIDAAIEAAAKEFDIDASKLALSGFSREGYRALFTFTHPGRFHFLAGLVADSVTDSYSEYLWKSAFFDWGALQEYEAPTGGSFWTAPQSWLKYETTFSFDNINTAILFTQHGQPLSEWNYAIPTIGALVRNKKVFEFAFLPRGNHYLIRPREFVAENQLIVDWYKFWLLGIEPQDSKLRVRWHELRETASARVPGSPN